MFEHEELARHNCWSVQPDLQELAAISLRSAATAALQAARAASSHPQLQQQPPHTLQALAPATSGLALGLLPEGHDLLTDHPQQRLVESQIASALDGHADVRHVSHAPGQEEAWSSKHSVATEADQLSGAMAGQQQQQQQQLRQELNLPWNNDNQADSLGLQQQQQQQQVQSLEVPVPHNQSSDAGGSAEGGLKGAVESASEGQDEAAKAAYQQWSASFEARMVSCFVCPFFPVRCVCLHFTLTSLISIPSQHSPHAVMKCHENIHSLCAKSRSHNNSRHCELSLLLLFTAVAANCHLP